MFRAKEIDCKRFPARTTFKHTVQRHNTPEWKQITGAVVQGTMAALILVVVLIGAFPVLGSTDGSVRHSDVPADPCVNQGFFRLGVSSQDALAHLSASSLRAAAKDILAIRTSLQQLNKLPRLHEPLRVLADRVASGTVSPQDAVKGIAVARFYIGLLTSSLGDPADINFEAGKMATSVLRSDSESTSMMAITYLGLLALPRYEALGAPNQVLSTLRRMAILADKFEQAGHSSDRDLKEASDLAKNFIRLMLVSTPQQEQ